MSKPLNRLLDQGDRFEMHIEGLQIAIDSALETVVNQRQVKIQTIFPVLPQASLNNKLVELVSKKDDTGIVKMRGTIVQIDLEGSCAALTIELVEDIEQMQRRAFYRLPIIRDVVAECALDDCDVVEGITQNLSAGGMRCVMPRAFNPGEVVNIGIRLDGNLQYFKSKVLQSVPADAFSDKSYVRVEFLNVSEKARAHLLSYIFSEQSKQQRSQRH